MKEYCIIDQTEHDHHRWKGHYNIESKKMEYVCGEYFVSAPIEFVPQNVKEDRERYAVDILQPHRDGKPSLEFIRAYPKQAKKMFTKEEMSKAKPVWKDTKGLEKLQK